MYANPPIRAIFLAKSLNPPIFSFKSETAPFKSLEWYSFTATDGTCCFLCQFLERFRFIACFCNSSAKRPKKTDQSDPNLVQYPRSTPSDMKSPESGPKLSANPQSAVFLKSAQCIECPFDYLLIDIFHQKSLR